jgi:hypothetical protein
MQALRTVLVVGLLVGVGACGRGGSAPGATTPKAAPPAPAHVTPTTAPAIFTPAPATQSTVPSFQGKSAPTRVDHARGMLNATFA